MELAERIIDNLKYGIKNKTSQSILTHIINALNGDKIHFSVHGIEEVDGLI